MSKDVMSHIGLLGHKAKDKVTGAEGVITTVAFDLYGCIQAAMHSGLTRDGTQKEQFWYDVSRLEITSKKSVMDQPNYNRGYVAEGRQGCSEKPKMIGV